MLVSLAARVSAAVAECRLRNALMEKRLGAKVAKSTTHQCMIPWIVRIAI